MKIEIGFNFSRGHNFVTDGQQFLNFMRERVVKIVV